MFKIERDFYTSMADFLRRLSRDEYRSRSSSSLLKALTVSQFMMLSFKQNSDCFSLFFLVLMICYLQLEYYLENTVQTPNVTSIFPRYNGPQQKYNIPHNIKNSTRTGVKSPNENLRALSIDLSALLIANTVFLALIL